MSSECWVCGGVGYAMFGGARCPCPVLDGGVSAQRFDSSSGANSEYWMVTG
jgi:hypothetical protein